MVKHWGGLASLCWLSITPVSFAEPPTSDWLSAYATPTDLRQSDWIHLWDQHFEKAKIVGLGEDTHGTAEFTELAEMLMIHLAEHHGYRVLFLENGFGETTFLNDYIHGRLEDADQLLKSKVSTWRYQTTQFKHLLHRLRAFNQAHPDDSIQLYGMEMHYPLEEAKRLNDYLQKHGLPLLTAPFDKTLYQSLSEEEKADAFIAYHKAKQVIFANQQRLIAEGGEREFHFARLVLSILGQYVAAIVQSEERHRSELRDMYMEANVTQVLASLEQGSRALVWAHNAHIGDWVSNGQVDVLGHHLRKRYGQGYFKIATHFGIGTYLAFPHDAEKVGWKLTSIGREQIESQTLTQSLAGVSRPDAMVDFTRIRQDPIANRQLLKPQVLMSGGGAQAYGMVTTEVALGTAFDGLLFLSRSTSIQRLP